MRRYRTGGDDATAPSAERVLEARQLDEALNAMGSKFSPGYKQRLSVLDRAICGFVDGLRLDGLGPAEVLISLKERLAARAIPSGDVDAVAIRRCIARYYEN